MMMGLSRKEFFLTQVLLGLALAIFSAFLLVFWAMAKGLVHSTDLSVGSILGKTYFVAAYFLEVIAFLSFALLILTLLRKSGLSIIAFSISFIAIEPIIRFYVPDVVAQNLPFKRIGSMIDVPNTSLMQLFGFNFKTYIDLWDLSITLLFTVLFLVFTYQIIHSRDL